MKLSIITVNLNNSEGLQKTIESVVSQTFTDLEYIVIDGGSTDGSVDIIKQYADKITYWVSEPDKGIYNAMNKGILQAKGEYCQFLNSGDVLYTITVLNSIFGLNCAEDIITGDMIKIFSDNITKVDKGQAYTCQQRGQDLTLYDMYSGTINHSSSFIRRELFEKYGLYDENYKIVSDWIFFLMTIGLAGTKVKYVDIVVSYFDMTGISNTNITLRNEERRNALEKTVPKQILDDYKYFKNLEQKYQNLEQQFGYIFKYKTTRFIARLVNKTIKMFG